ncbi:MAG: leucyl aminopeptidase, partial [Candidatus Zixiibacteriota bacterium]
RVLLVGLGERKKLDHDAVRRAAGRVSGARGLKSSKSAAFCLVGSDDPCLYHAAIEGYLLGSYKLLEFKSEQKPEDITHLVNITFIVRNRSRLRAIRAAVERGRIIAEGQLLVRRLAFLPANQLTPRLFAEEARRLAKDHRFGCQVLDEKAIEKEKMGGLLGVARGSTERPRFIILKYNGGRAGARPVVLVGKGVTFDAGGISLKQALNMHEMKGDMSGAAAVLGAVVTAARLKLKLNLVGLIPATENMPSGSATRPGDVLKTRKGLTVEVINTDAEGRLILADALDYANTFKPQAVIDIATLTGASLYILGYAGAPVLGNHAGLLQRVKNASKATAEKVWQLPIWDEHRDLMKSPIADLKNSAGKPAGTIAASAFLENFIGDWPWLHIDIAYMDLEPEGKPYTPKGASGFGLRLLVELLSNWK